MSNQIYSYDFHTYWHDADVAEKKFCAEFRDKVATEFASELKKGKLRLHKLWDRPIGPHPIHMWELDTAGAYEPALFARVLAFYQLYHGKLSVLIHPRSDLGELLDHTEHALWLGHKQRLVTQFLESD